MSAVGWLCGAFQPVSPFQPGRPPLHPYRCTELWGHKGPHRAMVDEDVVAEWPRRYAAEKETDR